MDRLEWEVLRALLERLYARGLLAEDTYGRALERTGSAPPAPAGGRETL